MLASLWQESVKSVGRDGADSWRPSWPRNATPLRRSPMLSSSSSAGWPHTRRAGPRRHGAARRHGPSGVARSFLRRPRDRHDLLTANAAARNVSIDMVQAELVRRLNQTSAASLGHRASAAGARRTLPAMRPPNPTRRIRLPSSEREWVEAETARRVDAYADCGALLHGDLADLASPPRLWQDVPDAVTEADLLERRSTSWSSHIPTPAIQIASTSFSPGG